VCACVRVHERLCVHMFVDVVWIEVCVCVCVCIFAGLPLTSIG